LTEAEVNVFDRTKVRGQATILGKIIFYTPEEIEQNGM